MPSITPLNKALILINVIVFVLQEYLLGFVQPFRFHQERAHRAQRIERLPMLRAEHSLIQRDCAAKQRLGFGRVAQVVSHHRQPRQMTNVLRMFLGARAAIDLQRLSQIFLRDRIITPLPGNGRKVVQRDRY